MLESLGMIIGLVLFALPVIAVGVVIHKAAPGKDYVAPQIED